MALEITLELLLGLKIRVLTLQLLKFCLVLILHLEQHARDPTDKTNDDCNDEHKDQKACDEDGLCSRNIEH